MMYQYFPCYNNCFIYIQSWWMIIKIKSCSFATRSLFYTSSHLVLKWYKLDKLVTQVLTTNLKVDAVLNDFWINYFWQPCLKCKSSNCTSKFIRQDFLSMILVWKFINIKFINIKFINESLLSLKWNLFLYS